MMLSVAKHPLQNKIATKSDFLHIDRFCLCSKIDSVAGIDFFNSNPVFSGPQERDETNEIDRYRT